VGYDYHEFEETASEYEYDQPEDWSLLYALFNVNVQEREWPKQQMCKDFKSCDCGKGNKCRHIGNELTCEHCKKKGHSIWSCWNKYNDLVPEALRKKVSTKQSSHTKSSSNKGGQKRSPSPGGAKPKSKGKGKGNSGSRESSNKSRTSNTSTDKNKQHFQKAGGVDRREKR